MPADRLLSTLLRSLQTYTDQQDTPRLLSTAASLYTTLSNPHNLTLLSTQLLVAPAIWARPDGLLTCLRIMSVYHTAAGTLLRHHNTVYAGEKVVLLPGQIPLGGNLKLEEWAQAVVKGADERSERWKHLLVLGGLLIGLHNNDDWELAKGVKSSLSDALVKVINIVLEEPEISELGGHCVAMVLNHAFPTLTDSERSQINYERLLPVLVGATFFSREGFQSGYYLGPIDPDVKEVPGKKFEWPVNSPSFKQIERTLSRPLVGSMGPMARLIAHAVDNVQDPWLIQPLVEDLLGFSHTLLKQWKNTKLSEIDISEEALFLHEDAMRDTIPQLWKLLKSTLFATTIVLRSVMGRLIRDPVLASDRTAPVLVVQTLNILRDLYFISSRLGSNAFSQYTFVYLTAMDIASQYPIQIDSFLKDIRPTELGHIPKHPLDRCLDLYFLNTAEHFALVLSSQTNEDLLVAAATPYLAAGGNRNLMQIFEAAHSVMLAVLSAPQSAATTAKHLPFYVDALFKVFPDTLSPRQFRVAFKTLLRVTAPPSPLSATQPDLPAVLLELLHERALHAPTTALPPPVASPMLDLEEDSEPVPPLSEQSVLILTLLDTLPFLPVLLLEEWLPLCADLINSIQSESMREACKKRLWEVMIGGEMDPDRSQSCVAWWSTRGGRKRVLLGREDPSDDGHYMSGALQPQPVEGTPRDNKL